MNFWQLWGKAALTTLGFFWMAFWAFCLGYVVSSVIQVFVTKKRMQETMGKAGSKSVTLGTFFGFISSSCSFAALSTTRALFQKGAGLIPSLAFLLASTNLVIELGILIFIFLSWQFVLAEYMGGIILILIMSLIVKLTLPEKLEQKARENAQRVSENQQNEITDWKKLVRSLAGWQKVAKRYFMEWKMVWKDIIFGFTVAGAIAVFVPPEIFQTLFIGSGGDDLRWWQIALHTLIGPIAAFFTFIGSMGNIPLAGILFGSGVSFAGIMAFIYSDLVVFPVLRISSEYFGLKMAIYILFVFLLCLISTALILHYSFMLIGILPESTGVQVSQKKPAEHFKIDYTFFLNLGFFVLSCVMAVLWWAGRSSEKNKKKGHKEKNWSDYWLTFLAIASLVWLGTGIVLWIVN